MAPTTRNTTRETTTPEQSPTATTTELPELGNPDNIEEPRNDTNNPDLATTATAITGHDTSRHTLPLRNPMSDGTASEVSIHGVSSDSRWKMTESQILNEGATHYHGWTILAGIYLKSAGLFDLVTGIEAKPEATQANLDAISAWQTRDAIATAQLSTYVSLGLLTLLDTSSAASMWLSIQSQFQFTGAAAIILANRELTGKTIGPTESMEDHVQSLRRLKSAYLSAGGTLTTDQWKVIIIQSLQHKWTQYKPTAMLVDDPDKIIAFLLIESKSAALNSFSSSESALATTTRKRYEGPPCTIASVRGTVKPDVMHPVVN